MVTIVLVIGEPALRQLFQATLHLGRAETEGFDVRYSNSLGNVKGLVPRNAAALILFDYKEGNAALLSEVGQLRKAAPGCIVCAVSAEREFYRKEAKALESAGVHDFLDESDVKDAKRLIAFLHDIAAILSGSRVFSFLQPILPSVPLPAAHITLAAVCNVTRSDVPLSMRSRIRRARRRLGPRPPVSAEREDVSVRLLLLIDLVETCHRTVSALYGLAGFPSAKDACELLRAYAMVEARELMAAAARNRARARLVQILLAQALPERRRYPRSIREGSREPEDQPSGSESPKAR